MIHSGVDEMAAAIFSLELFQGYPGRGWLDHDGSSVPGYLI
jgi:hypothetical protein